MTEGRRCDGYGLSMKGLEGVTFCRKEMARITHELVQGLRDEVARLAAEVKNYEEKYVTRTSLDAVSGALKEAERLRDKFHDYLQLANNTSKRRGAQRDALIGVLKQVSEAAAICSSMGWTAGTRHRHFDPALLAVINVLKMVPVVNAAYGETLDEEVTWDAAFYKLVSRGPLGVEFRVMMAKSGTCVHDHSNCWECRALMLEEAYLVRES